MRTVHQLLKRMRACPRALKKYARYRRGFKVAFIDAHWQDAKWFGGMLFSMYVFGSTAGWPSKSKYPNLPVCYNYIDTHRVGQLFRLKANRIKYWPDVERRLKELGVEL